MKIGYIIQRLCYLLFVFLIVVTLCFFIPRIGVDDPAARYYPSQGTMSDEDFEVIKELTRQQYELDGSMWSQYTRYIEKLLDGDLGTSYQAGSPQVVDLITQRIPWTLALSIPSLLISLFFGILIGAKCAMNRSGLGDRLLLSASTILTAIPSFFIALMLALFLGFIMEIFPAYTDPNMVSNFTWSIEGISTVAYNACLPVLSSIIGGIIGYAQSVRNSVIAVSNENFIVTAKAKGLSHNSVVYKHVLRNALLPIVTGLGMSISGLVGGSVLIENIFNWQGIGTLFLEANNTNDYPLMMGIMIMLSGLTLIGNFVTDLTYGILDRRVTMENL